MKLLMEEVRDNKYQYRTVLGWHRRCTLRGHKTHTKGIQMDAGIGHSLQQSQGVAGQCHRAGTPRPIQGDKGNNRRI